MHAVCLSQGLIGEALRLNRTRLHFQVAHPEPASNVSFAIKWGLWSLFFSLKIKTTTTIQQVSLLQSKNNLWNMQFITLVLSLAAVASAAVLPQQSQQPQPSQQSTKQKQIQQSEQPIQGDQKVRLNRRSPHKRFRGGFHGNWGVHHGGFVANPWWYNGAVNTGVTVNTGNAYQGQVVHNSGIRSGY